MVALAWSGSSKAATAGRGGALNALGPRIDATDRRSDTRPRHVWTFIVSINLLESPREEYSKNNIAMESKSSMTAYCNMNHVHYVLAISYVFPLLSMSL